MMLGRMGKVIALWMGVFGLLGSMALAEEHAAALPLAQGKGVIEEDGGGVLVTFDLTRPVPWRVWMEEAPPSLVIEFSEFEMSELPKVRSSSIGALDAAQTAVHTTEFRALLREPLSLVSAEMITPEDGSAALQVALQATTGVTFGASGDEAEAAEDAASTHLVVALDPGHGGIDPGAESGDLREADLVLAFARRLVPVLEATGRFDAVLTRESDEFLPLDARLTQAREAGADILISLHADALEDADAAAGLVIYSLAGKAVAAADWRLIERHSGDDRLTGVDLTNAGDDLSLALLELARQDTIPRTHALSAALLGAFESADLPVNSRPERSGAFAVLKAADIPSVLIELGFISTEADLKRLTSEAWQAEAALALRDGLLLWADEDRLRAR